MQYRLFAMIAFAVTAVALPQSDIPIREVGAPGNNDVKTAVMPGGTPSTMDAPGPNIVPIEPTKTNPEDARMSILPYTGDGKNSTGFPGGRPSGRPGPGKGHGMIPGLTMIQNGTEPAFCMDLEGMPKFGGMGMGGKPPGMKGGKKIETRDDHKKKKDDDSDDEDDKEIKNVGVWSGKEMGEKKKHDGKGKGMGGMGGRRGGMRGKFDRRMKSIKCERFTEVKCGGSVIAKGDKGDKTAKGDKPAAKSIRCTKKAGGRGGMGRGGKGRDGKNGTVNNFAGGKGKDWWKNKNKNATTPLVSRDVEDTEDVDYEIEDDLLPEEVAELEGRSIPLF